MRISGSGMGNRESSDSSRQKRRIPVARPPCPFGPPVPSAKQLDILSLLRLIPAKGSQPFLTDFSQPRNRGIIERRGNGAWTCEKSMSRDVVTSAELLAAKQRMLRVDLRGRGIRDRRTLEAIAKVPREQFVPADMRHDAYVDNAMAIGDGQTISQPYMVALMTEALELTGSERILEIGTGSGYQTAILAEIAQQVVTMERIPELSCRAVKVLDLLGYRNVTALVGDGTLGYEGEAPYDRILVTAGAERVPPALLDQLAEGGLLVMPVGGADCQVLHVVRRGTNGYETTSLTACRFVPLVGQQGWPNGSD